MELKSGYTTGTTAAAAVVAAGLGLAGRVPDFVRVPLPPFENYAFLDIPIENAGRLPGGGYYAEARKDGGDDPDVTSGMLIRASSFPSFTSDPVIDGGAGIGRATLPGLPIPVGSAAINPVPRMQMHQALRIYGIERCKTLLTAPEGEERSQATLNSRLGILGGISILGTQGIVMPYSNKAWQLSIERGLSVATASGLGTVCLVTGRRSAKLAEKHISGLKSHGIIVAGDFVHDALYMARNFKELHWGCFFGKLVKLARGNENTHASESRLDLCWLAQLIGLPCIEAMTTAAQALEYIRAAAPERLLNLILRAKDWASNFAGRDVIVHLFDFDGQELARA